MAEDKFGAGPLPSTSAGDTIAGNSGTSASVAVGGSATGIINTAGDDDWFQVDLVAGQSYVFTATGEAVDSSSALQDTYLELYNPFGVLVAVDDDAGPGTDSMLRFTATQTGTYYLNARAWEPDTGATLTGGYRITADTGPAQDPLDSIDLGFEVIDTNITYYLATEGQSYAGETSLRDWNATETAALTAAFATFSAVTPLTFTQVSSSASADLIIVLADLDPGTLGSFLGNSAGGYLFFSPTVGEEYWSANALTPGGLGFTTLLHEMGHALGLAHPHDNSGNSEIMQGVLAPFNSLGTYLLNQGVFTVMTYNPGLAQSLQAPLVTGNPATPMALDIGLLQQKYGANTNYNNSDTVYTLPNTNAVGTSYSTIWDTGGVDTIVSTFNGSATIDLRPASLLNAQGGGGYISSNSNIYGGFTIAAGVVIENARGGSGADEIIGNHVANEILGMDGDDLLTGHDGNDWLEGGAGYDRLLGGDGNDTLLGGNGVDIFIGGNGTDTIVYNRGTIGVEVNLVGNYGRGGEAEGDAFDSIEDIVGSNFGDQLTGSAANNFIFGVAGDDRLWGDAGDDILIGGAGADILTGGAGVDATSYHNSSSGVRIVLFQYIGRYGEAEGDQFGSIENIIGSPFQDEIFGDNANNELYGQEDVDVLEGDAGDDYLDGGAGADKIYGQDGNDTLYGGEGQDRLFGGGGADRFFYRDVSESLVGTPDEIVEFTRAHGDKIDLSGIDANTNVGGDQAFSFIGAAAFSSTAGELRYAGNFLEADVNGDGNADFQVQLNVASLQSDDFLL